jgi:SpoIID/LytB domain protein
MGAGLIVSGVASVLVGMSLASCQTTSAGPARGTAAGGATADRAATQPRGPEEVSRSITALAGINGEPEIRVRIAEGTATAKFSGPEMFWVVPVATLGPSAVVQNTRSDRLRGPIEVTLADNTWIVRDGVDRLHRYPVRENGKAGARDLEVEGIGPDETVAPSIAFNNVPYSGYFRVTLPSGTASLTPPAAGAAASAPPPPGTFDVVEHVGLETYLPGVVAKELYRDWPLAAFKVQAVCARSYALHERQRAMAAGRRFDLESTTRDQAYAGATALPVANDAVKQTRGVVLAYGPGVLRAYYSSTCGGRPGSAADTWPTYKGFEFNLAPPLQGRAREFACQGSPLFQWRVERPKDELVRRLAIFGERNSLPIRRIRDLARVEVSRANETGRPAEYRLIEPDGTWYMLKAEELRLACNTDEPAKAGKSRLPAITRQTRVNSGDLEADVQGSTVYIAGRGFGHGVGMCQYCTRAMADRGDPWLVTLHKFYPGARVVRAY